MKYLLILPALFMAGCQAYPKKAAGVSIFADRVAVNKTIPSELQPYYVPTKRQNIVVNNTQLPSVIYVLAPQETLEGVKARVETASPSSQEIDKTTNLSEGK